MSYIRNKLLGYLRLMRPANIITAVADILAGVAISGFWLVSHTFTADWLLPVLCLALATGGLYGGGVVFNDVFDAQLDSRERPERPIPSGVVSKTQAVILGIYLLMIGVLAAFTVNPTAGFIALLTALAALVYNKWGKHLDVAGPINMGICRGLNLLLGMSIAGEGVLLQYGWLALVPVLYIGAITMISRDEVHGGKTGPLKTAGLMYLVVCLVIAAVAVLQHRVWETLPFIALFCFLIYTPLLKAMKEPTGPNIGKSVKGGIIALIVMNAAWATAFAGFVPGLIILALLPVSMALGKAFAVT
ncbi:UbiA-like protein EboC [Chitinophaga horti]|uniref:UbiA-like protein EboC n=1 Tax=Chitinophaga horti TaxID=2920382 RepID=A0ABY6J138_9BACT|nr:UbiA-like protein EboC [Chitinophaga horti]UYQ92081.1 UbiA-like protein EboC [Chitinophaga horti]